MSMLPCDFRWTLFWNHFRTRNGFYCNFANKEMNNCFWQFCGKCTSSCCCLQTFQKAIDYVKCSHTKLIHKSFLFNLSSCYVDRDANHLIWIMNLYIPSCLHLRLITCTYYYFSLNLERKNRDIHFFICKISLFFLQQDFDLPITLDLRQWWDRFVS